MQLTDMDWIPRFCKVSTCQTYYSIECKNPSWMSMVEASFPELGLTWEYLWKRHIPKPGSVFERNQWHT